MSDDDCICGHRPDDHRRMDVADDLKADWFDPAAPPTELRVMRSFCGHPIGYRDLWGWQKRCSCVLYTPTALLARQFAAAASPSASSATVRADVCEEGG